MAEGSGPPPDDPAIAAWFLSPAERGDPRTDVDRQRGDERHTGDPPGRRPRPWVRAHGPTPVPRPAARRATRAYRAFVDPDGRPRRLRRRGEF